MSNDSAAIRAATIEECAKAAEGSAPIASGNFFAARRDQCAKAAAAIRALSADDGAKSLSEDSSDAKRLREAERFEHTGLHVEEADTLDDPPTDATSQAIKDAHEHVKQGIGVLQARSIPVPMELHRAAHALSHALNGDGASPGDGK